MYIVYEKAFVCCNPLDLKNDLFPPIDIYLFYPLHYIYSWYNCISATPLLLFNLIIFLILGRPYFYCSSIHGIAVVVFIISAHLRNWLAHPHATIHAIHTTPTCCSYSTLIICENPLSLEILNYFWCNSMKYETYIESAFSTRFKEKKSMLVSQGLSLSSMYFLFVFRQITFICY